MLQLCSCRTTAHPVGASRATHPQVAAVTGRASVDHDAHCYWVPLPEFELKRRGTDSVFSMNARSVVVYVAMSAIVHVAVSTAVQTGACEPGHYQCGVTGNGTRPDTIYACTAWGEWVPQEDCASAPGGPHVCRVLSDNVPHCVPPGKGCKPGQYRCGESPANNASTIYACDAFGNWVFGYDCPPPSSCRVLADRQPHCV